MPGPAHAEYSSRVCDLDLRIWHGPDPSGGARSLHRRESGPRSVPTGPWPTPAILTVRRPPAQTRPSRPGRRIGRAFLLSLEPRPAASAFVTDLPLQRHLFADQNRLLTPRGCIHFGNAVIFMRPPGSQDAPGEGTRDRGGTRNPGTVRAGAASRLRAPARRGPPAPAKDSGPGPSDRLGPIRVRGGTVAEPGGRLVPCAGSTSDESHGSSGHACGLALGYRGVRLLGCASREGPQCYGGRAWRVATWDWPSEADCLSKAGNRPSPACRDFPALCAS